MHSSTAWKDFKVKIISNAEVTWKIHTVYISKIHKKLNEIFHWKFSNKQLLLCNKICFFSWTKTMRKWNFRLYNCLPFRWRIFFNCYLGVSRPTLGHSWEDNLTKSMFITVFSTILARMSPGPSYRCRVLKPVWTTCEVWTGNLQILISTP